VLICLLVQFCVVYLDELLAAHLRSALIVYRVQDDAVLAVAQRRDVCHSHNLANTNNR